MKHLHLFIRILAVVLSLVLILPASADSKESGSSVPTVSFKKCTAPVDSESIDLGKVKVEEKDFPAFYDFLRQLPNLKHVDMFSTRITAPYIEELTTLFPDVEFGWTMQFTAHKHLVRTDAETFSTLHYDHDKRHTEEDFALLKYCRNLLALDIGHNELHDLSFLYDLPNLRVLILSDDQISCDITPIGSLHNLLFLEMYKNQITDITPLASLSNLRHLNIDFNLVKDLTPLQYCTNLENLWIAYANSSKLKEPVDQETLDILTAALPNTRINSTARVNDGGGWLDFRDEKRVKTMFRERVYILLECERQKDN